MKRLIGLLIALQPAQAFACPPPPPPPSKAAGESDAHYGARMAKLDREKRSAFLAGQATRQADLWLTSSAVFVGRIEKVHLLEPENPYGLPQKVFVRPVRQLKGPMPQPFWLQHPHTSDCGPFGAGDAPEGHVGAEFVLFANGAGSASVVVDSISQANAVDPRIVAALTTSSKAMQ